MAKRTAASPTTTTRKRATPKKPNGASDTPVAHPEAPGVEEIRVRAYHRYLERGAGHGSDFDDWVAAEKDLKTTRP